MALKTVQVKFLGRHVSVLACIVMGELLHERRESSEEEALMSLVDN